MTFIDTTPYTHDGAPVLKLLADMVDAAAASLAQTPRGIPGTVLLWHDQPIDDCCDGIFLWVQEWVPVTVGSFPLPASGPDVCRPFDMDPRVVLSLRRPCAPIPDGAGRVDLSAEGEAAEDLIIDARALMCGVFASWPDLLQANYPGHRISYGPMTPTGASLDCQGLDWSLMLELSGCRGACS